jgi:hypothetical protein
MLLSVLFVLAGCASLPPPESGTLLDQSTGSTLLFVTRPMVFSRERSDVAAFARDYATLVAIETDVGGVYQYYLLLYRWSTVDKRMAPLPLATHGELHLEGDGRVIVLPALAQVPVSEANLAALYYPPHADAVTHAYRTDAATLRFIAQTSRISLRLPQELLDIPFSLREDGRASLAQFVRAERAAQ